MKYKSFVFLSLILLPAMSFCQEDPLMAKIQDPQGNIYPIIHLKNGKSWLAKNLNYDVDEGSECYMQDQSNCQIYGKLYTYEAAIKGCKSLGVGWRLPTEEDVVDLAMNFDPRYEWKRKAQAPKSDHEVAMLLIEG